jgi:hypothetical protein
VAISESDSVAAGNCPQEEVITRKWTATDDCGNASSCAQTVTVVDVEDPAIACPADITVNCEDDSRSSNTGVATATDNCDSDPEISHSTAFADGSCPQEGVITRTWTATDDCGNASSCDQIVTVVDDENPAITCPGDVTVNCEDDRTSAATGKATATDNCDNDVAITEIDSVAAGRCAQEEVITRKWTATDACGNASSCAQTVTVIDVEDPAITCPDDTTVNCEDSRGADNTGVATATDNCDANVGIMGRDSIAAGSCPQEEVITRTWTATDACGNASSCEQTISVVDDAGPTMSCPADATVNCDGDSSSSITGVATATDNCDGQIDISESDSVAGGSCPQEEVITRTWTGKDDCGNVSSCDQLVSVVDDEAPTITCPADATVECEDDRSSAATGAATATDSCDGEIDISESDSVFDGSCPQEEVITRTWTGTDDCGNASSCDQVVTVVDTTPPEVQCNGYDITEFDGDDDDDDDDSVSFTATATDLCSDVRIKVGWIVCLPPPGDDDDDDDDCKVSAHGATIKVIDSGAPGTVISWTAKSADDCGNITAVSCSVTVLEAEEEEEEEDDDHDHGHGYDHDKPWWWHWRHW